MKLEKVTKILLFLTLTFFLCGGSAGAEDFGTNIKIWDGIGTGPGWWGDREDEEVEPGCATGQQWDLEAFMLKDSILTMVGGYDFKNGAVGNGLPFMSGDIFIDTNNNRLNYEYILDLDFTTETYDIYALDTIYTLDSVYYSQNQASNPWKLNSGGRKLNSEALSMDLFGYDPSDPLTDADTGFLGGSHYAVSVSLGFLNPGTTFTSHFTMECGNDNLMGSGITNVSEPATMILLGSSLVGLAGFSRKRIIKSRQA